MCKWGTDKMITLCKPKEHSKRIEIAVDACLADIVQALNNFGIETLSCCCGHGKTDGEIMLTDGRTLVITRKEK